MSSPQHEPTMEEILASIRKIISEDSPGDAPAAPAPAEVQPMVTAAPPPAPAQPVHNEADVLELTQEVVETPAPQTVAADDIIFQPDTPAPGGNDIFSDRTRKALDDAFASIPDDEPAPAPVRPAPAAWAPVAGLSVESVFERAVRESFEPVLQKYISDNSASVIERMKPLIREWMDDNFPALLESAVRTEVERVVKSRGKR